MLTYEYRYRILKLLEANPQASQRDIARELGISLGKVNYCLKALIEKGWVKANNFRQNEQKGAYLYLLTPKGYRRKGKGYDPIPEAKIGRVREREPET